MINANMELGHDVWPWHVPQGNIKATLCVFTNNHQGSCLHTNGDIPSTFFLEKID
jgi:hypothetical protein